MLLQMGTLRHLPREPTVPIRGPEQHDDGVPALTAASPLSNGSTGFATADARGTRQVRRVVLVRPLAHPASPTTAAAADAAAIAATVTAAAAATPAAAAAAASAATAAVTFATTASASL